MAMNSMAQQAVPNGIGHMEDLRPHFPTASTVVVMTSPPLCTPGYVVGSISLPRKMSSSPMGEQRSYPTARAARSGGQGVVAWGAKLTTTEAGKGGSTGAGPPTTGRAPGAPPVSQSG